MHLRIHGSCHQGRNRPTWVGRLKDMRSHTQNLDGHRLNPASVVRSWRVILLAFCVAMLVSVARLGNAGAGDAATDVLFATPSGRPPSACAIAPRPVSDFALVDEASDDGLSLMLGTPIATPTPPYGGEPANPAIVASVTDR